MDYSRIPEELKNQNQWVCAWDGSKVPMRAFERKSRFIHRTGHLVYL